MGLQNYYCSTVKKKELQYLDFRAGITYHGVGSGAAVRAGARASVPRLVPPPPRATASPSRSADHRGSTRQCWTFG